MKNKQNEISVHETFSILWDMWPLRYLALLVFIHVFSFLLTGCGSDSSNQVSPEVATAQQSMRTMIDAKMPAYKVQCIDNNIPFLNTAKTNCLTSGSSDLFCTNNYNDSIQKLNNTWNDIESAAAANMLACSVDFRVSADYCFAQHEVEITRRLYECGF